MMPVRAKDIMRYTLITLTAMIVSLKLVAEEKPSLSLDVYVIDAGTRMEVHSIITNVSDKSVTVPTHSYSGGVDGWATGGERIGIFFSIGCNEVGKHKLVPSPSRFFPVTLEPGESSELPLTRPHRHSEKTVAVYYTVDEGYARRYGWWFGSLKKEVVIGEGDNPYISKIGPPSLIDISDDVPEKKKEPNQPVPTRMDACPEN